LADTVDHVVPFSRGGEVLVSACRPCNQSKGKKTPAEWRGAEFSSESLV
jgi:5-methylcytosine-specific restriction endonuclease McrA